MRTAIAVEFETVIDKTNNMSSSRNVRVPLDEVGEFHKGKYGFVHKVFFVDENGIESWSWGKSWIHSETGELLRIGAGAYGDTIVWRKEN